MGCSPGYGRGFDPLPYIGAPQKPAQKRKDGFSKGLTKITTKGAPKKPEVENGDDRSPKDRSLAERWPLEVSAAWLHVLALSLWTHFLR